jgi:hypothetical protein
VDYALRAAVPDDSSNDEACDNFACICIILGMAAQADLERGDPPATCAAHAVAVQAGPQHAQAFSLLEQIRDCSDAWTEEGRAHPALPGAQMTILQAAARGETVDAAKLAPVLAKAEELAEILAGPILRRS